MNAYCGCGSTTPHLRVFGADAETFVDLYKQLQSLVPEGRPGTPVRLQRTPRVSSAVESTLQETLGAESQVLVIVGPAELPRVFHSLDVVSGQLACPKVRPLHNKVEVVAKRT